MTSPQPVLLISDACVLIDFCKAGCEDILFLVSRHILPIHVPLVVLKEVEGLDKDKAAEIGITVAEVTVTQITEATAVRRGPSQQDRLCMIVARDCGGAVWSNDRRLRTLCKEHGVTPFWGLEIILLLVKGNHLDGKRASAAATLIHKIDPHYITTEVLEDFFRKLNVLMKRQATRQSE